MEDTNLDQLSQEELVKEVLSEVEDIQTTDPARYMQNLHGLTKVMPNTGGGK